MLFKGLKIVLAVFVVSVLLAGIAVACPGGSKIFSSSEKQQAKAQVKGDAAHEANDNVAYDADTKDNDKVIVEKGKKRTIIKVVYEPRKDRDKNKDKWAKKFGSVTGLTLLACESTPTSGTVDCTPSVENTHCTKSAACIEFSKSCKTSPSVECSKSAETSPSIDGTGTPLAGVHLRLLKNKGKGFEHVSWATQSNKKGQFVFKNVKTGDYVLRVWSKSAVYNGSKPIAVHVEGGKATNLSPLVFEAKAVCAKAK
ncbi:MAG TPA: carboxypeptidase-like regulatory domain-containing protein [Candidatus Aquicultor sp.]|jgi:hypothetical protein